MTSTTVQVKQAYQTRAFSLAPDEQIQGTYGDLQRNGRQQIVVQLARGERLPMLTTPSESGMTYAETSKDGQRYAVLLLPDSYE